MARLFGVEPVRAVLERAHGLLEAPRFGPEGALVYSDVLAGGVWRCSAQGSLQELLPKRRGIGGIVSHADGGWVVSGRSVLHLAADGVQRELLADPEACGYNDLCATPEGDLLAGVLRYRPLAGEPPREGALVRLRPGGELRVLSERVIWPNGIGVSGDGRSVYVSDYERRAVLAVDAAGSGATQELLRVPRGSADGLALDADGGIWVALGDGGGVARFLPDGRLDEVTELPAGFVSSLCFGGADGCDVLVTTADNELEPGLGGTLLRARSEVPGVVVGPARV